jgi:hypothetical protein
MSTPISAMIVSAARFPTPVMVASRSLARANGAITASTRRSRAAMAPSRCSRCSSARHRRHLPVSWVAPAGPTDQAMLKRVLTATVRGAGKAPASVVSTGSLAPRKAELGRARPILIPRGGLRPCRSYQLSRAKRYADRRFPRSLPTVRGEVMRCSNSSRSSPADPILTMDFAVTAVPDGAVGQAATRIGPDMRS